MTKDCKKKEGNSKQGLDAEIERIGKILQTTTDAEEKELERIIQRSGKQVTDAQKEELRKVLRDTRITKAPSPISPVGFSPISRNSTRKSLDPQKDIFVPLTGVELMQKWSVGWDAIFDFARKDKLIPDVPKDLRRRIEYDFEMLSSYTQQDRDQYFSQWLYHPSEVEAFAAKHGETLDGWREKVVSIDVGRSVVIEKENSENVENALRNDFPQEVIEAARPILKEANKLYDSSIKEYGVKDFIKLPTKKKKETVIDSYNENSREYGCIQSEDLLADEIYNQFGLDKEKHQFTYKLLKVVMIRLGNGKLNYQKLKKVISSE